MIAKGHKMDLEQLLKLNPELGEVEVLQKGEMVFVAQVEPCVNVVVVEREVMEEKEILFGKK